MRKIKKRACFVVARREPYEGVYVYAIYSTRRKAEKLQVTIRCDSEIFETEMNIDITGEFCY